ncbi:MAG: TrkH family potassium uptake protein [Rhodobacteraceae bacterium]|nr:TrkH family potassium uptake protein [Paracoccaceae bacterium]
MGFGGRGTTILVALIGATAVAMLLPAAIGFTLREHALARAFLYSSALLTSAAGMIHLAGRNLTGRNATLAHPFSYLALIYLLLPALMAIPLTEAVPDLRFRDAWFEMIAAFTTTGASVIEGEITLSLHLWRALVAWGGGLFILVVATALLAPMTLGGFELFATQARRQTDLAGWQRAHRGSVLDETYDDRSVTRLHDQLRVIAPFYVGLTLALWVALSIAGNPPLVALIVAMSTLATSGIAPEPALMGGVSELLVAVVLLLALCRRVWPGAQLTLGRQPMAQDLELRTGLVLLGAIVVLMSLRLIVDGGTTLATLWGHGFTALSFLTTTGFVSGHAVGPDGVFAGPAGMVLIGLAMIGGGVATTAGGLKLMRAFALFWQARHEVERLVYPASVGGDGHRLRSLREMGAVSAWQFLMIFIFSLMALTALLTLAGLRMEDAIVFAVAALSTTGPLAQVAGDAPLSWSDLGDLTRAALGFGMILGRLELLLLLSIFWRR